MGGGGGGGPMGGGGGGGGNGLGSFLGGLVGGVLGGAVQPQPAPAPYPYPYPGYVVAPPPPVRYYAPPQPSPVILSEQTRLHDMGFYLGVLDGIPGPATSSAIVHWQASQGFPTTGILTSDEQTRLLSPTVVVTTEKPMQTSPDSKPAQPAQQAATVQAPAAAPAAPSPNDAVASVKAGMPYVQARTLLTNAGWQTGFIDVSNLDQTEAANRAWFIDHHFSEAEDCSPNGCIMQFHSMDGHPLYVFTTSGGKDADKVMGPSVVAVCLGNKDIACGAKS